MIIRPATIADIDNLVYIETVAFESNWMDLTQFKYYALHKTNMLCVGIEDKIIIGYYAVKFSKYKTFAFIDKLAVHPSFQNKGYGRLLIKDIEDKCVLQEVKKIKLQVMQTNNKAVDFYEKLNYVNTNTLPEIYDNGIGAILMEKQL